MISALFNYCFGGHMNKNIRFNPNIAIYMMMTIALLATLSVQGVINGNLKAEQFLYAIAVSVAFSVWAMVDAKFRQIEIK
jgi:hypothetical protein